MRAQREGGASLFARTLLVLLALVVLVQAANAAILLTAPPPRPEIYRLDEIIRVLRGDRSAEALEGLKVTVQDRPPTVAAPWRAGEPGSGRPGPNLERMLIETLADRLGAPESRIRVESARSPRAFMLRLRPGPEGGRRAEPPPFASDVRPGAEPRPPQGEGAFGPQGGRDRPGPGPGFSPPVIAPFKIAVQQADGRWLSVESRESLPTPWQQRALLWLLVSAAVCVPIAFFYARGLAAPIRRFAEAADRLGGDPGAAEVEVSGPAEVRLAGEAFNRMQARLRRNIESRANLVAAVAHDLRTPLARMRFLLETPTSDLRARLGREIDEMDAMVAATMAFVRDSTVKAARADLDLPSLLESLADDAAEEGHAVRLGDLAPAIVHGDPVGLRRLFDNLVRNGIKFGSAVTLSLGVENGEAVVEVADDGPGLPTEDLERAFEPFFRSEASRSRETGGIGLGLAVVRSIARAHGGDAVLLNRPEGGLICRVRLPLSATPRGSASQRPS